MRWYLFNTNLGWGHSLHCLTSVYGKVSLSWCGTPVCFAVYAFNGIVWSFMAWHSSVWFGMVPYQVWHQPSSLPVTRQKGTSNKKKNKQQSSMQQFTSPLLQTLSTHTHTHTSLWLRGKAKLKYAFLVWHRIKEACFHTLQHLRVGLRRSWMTRHFWCTAPAGTFTLWRCTWWPWRGKCL